MANATLVRPSSPSSATTKVAKPVTRAQKVAQMEFPITQGRKAHIVKMEVYKGFIQSLKQAEAKKPQAIQRPEWVVNELAWEKTQEYFSPRK